MEKPAEKAPPALDDVTECGTIHPGDIPVYMRDSVFRGLRDHSLSRSDVMVGGVLLGEWCVWIGKNYIVVEDFVRAEETKATGEILTMTKETWQRIAAEIERRYGRVEPMLIVGWYFTTLGKGLDPGQVSIDTHRKVFSQPWHLMIVIDPAANTLGLLQWRRGALASCGFYLVPDKNDDDSTA